MNLLARQLQYVLHKTWSILLWGLLFSHQSAGAQNGAIDILQTRLKDSSISNDSSANICRQLTRLYAKELKPKEALVVAKKEALLHEPQSSKLAEVYFNIASLHRAMAAYENAIHFADKALHIYVSKLGEAHIESLSLYKFLAQTYYLQEDYAPAIKLCKKAIKGYSKPMNKQASAEINLQLLLGSLHLKRAQYLQAQTAFLEAKQLYENAPKKVSIELLARIYSNLASLKFEQQATLEALAYYQEIAAIRKKLHHENHYTLQKTYTNIGMCYYQLLEPEKALVYHRKSLAILNQVHGEQHDLVAFSHTHIGGIYQRIEQEDSAQHHLLKAIKIYRAIFGNSSPKNIAPLWRLAKLFRQQNKYTKAEVTLEKTILIQQLHFGQFHPDLVKMYLNMAYIFQDQEQYSKASYYANKAYHTNLLHEQPLDKTLLLGIIDAQLSISLHQSPKKMTKAFVLLDKIQSLVALAQANLNYTTDRQNLTFNIRKVCERGIELCYQLYQNNPQKKYINRAFQLMEFNKAVLLSIQIKQEYWQVNLADTSLQEQQDLLANIQFLEQQWKKAEYESDSIKSQRLQEQLFDKHRAYEELGSKEDNSRLYHRPIKLATLQNQLSPEQVLINFFYGKNHLYLLKTEQNQVHLVQLDLDFEEQIQIFSSCLLDLEKSKVNLVAACQKYDEAAFALQEKLLPNINKKQLLLIPDGQLGYIPFEALTTQLNKAAKGYHQLHYALHKHTISYAYSATSYYYQQFKHLNRRDAKILAFAPDYNQHPILAPLKANVSEVAFLEEHFAGEFYYNGDATKERFQQQSSHFAVLHLASHGYADNHEMQQAQLFFTNVPTDSLAAILHPHEIVKGSFQADLISLSACQTAIGHWQEGEGIMSLARDFMYAGVPSILTTLWQINDKSSSLLIQDFYTQLKNLPKDEALQFAKQAYLKKASAFAAHPYFWSSYILLGNTNRLDLDTSSSINLWYLTAAFIILLLTLVWGFKTLKK
jgi:CHAT domain-containing protein